MDRYLAESIGTFALVFCGTGAIMIDQQMEGVISHLGIAITFGAIIMVMIYAVGSVSGAHFNPAVTIGFTIAGLFPSKEIVPYFFAQTIGAILASGCLRLLFPTVTTMGETLPSGPILQSFVLEIIITFFLMFVIIRLATDSKVGHIIGGFAIGMTVLLAALFAGPISGASMNPVRSLAPAIFTQNFHSLWIYFVAPIIGSIMAIGCWKIMK